MTTEDRLRALESALQQATGIITGLQGQLQKQAAAGPVQPSTGFNPIIDTRMLAKPRAFSGRDEDWSGWAVVTRAYCGALDPKLLDEMTTVEVLTNIQINLGMTDEEQKRSCTIYYIFVMLVEGRAQSMVTNCPAGCGTNFGADLYRPTNESLPAVPKDSLCRF